MFTTLFVHYSLLTHHDILFLFTSVTSSQVLIASVICKHYFFFYSKVKPSLIK